MNYFPAGASDPLERFPVPPMAPCEGDSKLSRPSMAPPPNGSLAPPHAPGGNGMEATAPLARGHELRAVTARVLVVDDDAGVLEVVIRMLRTAGYEVCAAADGEAGWDVINTHHFDLIITDHDMPRLTGVGLLRRLRTASSPVPVILISGRMPWHEPDLASLLVPGCAIAKPFEMAALLTQARGLLIPAAPAPASPEASPAVPLVQAVRPVD